MYPTCGQYGEVFGLCMGGGSKLLQWMNTQACSIRVGWGCWHVGAIYIYRGGVDEILVGVSFFMLCLGACLNRAL